jgi:hypothetical protein
MSVLKFPVTQVIDRIVQLMRERIDPVDVFSEVSVPPQVILNVVDQVFHRSHVAMNAPQVVAEVDLVVQAMSETVKVCYFASRRPQIQIVQSDRSQFLVELTAFRFDGDRQPIDARVQISVVCLRGARGEKADYCGKGHCRMAKDRGHDRVSLGRGFSRGQAQGCVDRTGIHLKQRTCQSCWTRRTNPPQTLDGKSLTDQPPAWELLPQETGVVGCDIT